MGRDKVPLLIIFFLLWGKDIKIVYHVENFIGHCKSNKWNDDKFLSIWFSDTVLYREHVERFGSTFHHNFFYYGERRVNLCLTVDNQFITMGPIHGMMANFLA